MEVYLGSILEPTVPSFCDVRGVFTSCFSIISTCLFIVLIVIFIVHTVFYNKLYYYCYPSDNHSTIALTGVRGAFNWPQFMPRDARLSNKQCQFSKSGSENLYVNYCGNIIQIIPEVIQSRLS